MGQVFGFRYKHEDFEKYLEFGRDIRLKYDGQVYFGKISKIIGNTLELSPYVVYHAFPKDEKTDIPFLSLEDQIPKRMDVGLITNHDPLKPGYLKNLIQAQNNIFEKTFSGPIVFDSKGIASRKKIRE